MGKQAVMLCNTLGYYSAGTVEFLVDENRNFYFLEMNTRLQVEHPITECITGVDLMHQMIRVAKGYALNIKQNDVKINGWAIESRVYAEDPYKSFGLPSIGRLYKYIEPTELPGVRCDSGIDEGSEISIYYDPMICKLVCYGDNRQQAIERSVNALDSYVIRGVNHNIPLLRDILTEEKFMKGDISTNYLPQVYGEGFIARSLSESDETKLVAVASAIYAHSELRNRSYVNLTNFRIHKALEEWRLVAFLNDRNISVSVSQDNGAFKVQLNGRIQEIKKNLNLAKPIVKAYINNEEVTMQLVSINATGEVQIM